MKKPKRKALVEQLMQETGLTGGKRTAAYFSRSQLLDLISIIRSYKLEVETLVDKLNSCKKKLDALTERVNDKNGRTENAFSN